MYFILSTFPCNTIIGSSKFTALRFYKHGYFKCTIINQCFEFMLSVNTKFTKDEFIILISSLKVLFSFIQWSLSVHGLYFLPWTFELMPRSQASSLTDMWLTICSKVSDKLSNHVSKDYHLYLVVRHCVGLKFKRCLLLVASSFLNFNQQVDY